MKKDFFKNSNSYTVSIIGVALRDDITHEPSIKAENYKSLSETGQANLSNNNNLTIRNEADNGVNKSPEGSDFETAIQAAKHGKFNWLLLFVAFWGYMSCMNATTTMSLILPSAECDLNLTNFDKGMLNSVIFIGMTVSAFFWGATSDAVGRKNVLIVSFALDAFFSILVGLAQNFTFLLVAKLFTGFISSGPIAILASFLAESHSNAYRGSVIVWTGIFTSSASVVLPFLAWLIIPRPIRIVLFNGYLYLPSWRIFLLVSAIPSISALIGLSFLDESPKFLMFQGKNEEALKVLKKIYNLNTGKPKDTFPIRFLRNEMGDDQKQMRGSHVPLKQIIIAGGKQMVPMFQKPYLPIATLTCLIQFCTLMGVNTVRLWSPQLFASAIEHEKSANLTSASTICDLLGPISEKKVEQVLNCEDRIIEVEVYFNSMITGVVTGVGYLISGYIVKILEKKWLMIIAYGLGIACCFALYWSSDSDSMLAVIAVYISVISTSATALVGSVVDIFPTSLRTMAVSLCITFGRLGAMTGNMIFPVLLDLHCTAPFVTLACIILCASGLTLFLPKTKGKHLE